MNQAPTRRLIITTGLMNQVPTKNQNLVNNYKKEDKVGLMNQASIKYLKKIFFQVAGSVRFF